MKLFYQSLNSGIKLPSPVFSQDDQGAAEQEPAEQEEGGKQEEPSRFANAGGLASLRSKGDESEGKEEEANAEPAKPGERPAHIPEKFWDAAKGEVRVDAMAKAYATAESALRNKGIVKEGDEVPESPEEYFGEDFSLDEEVDRIGLLPDDPGLKVAGEVFKKYGIGKATAAAIVKDMFKGMNEHAPAPMDPEEELKALGPNGRHVIDGTMVWLEKLDREGKLSDEDANTAIQLMSTASGVKFLNKLRGMTGEMPIPVGRHTMPTGGMSGEEWHEAYQEAVAKKDYKEQERLDSISASVFGSAPASGSPIKGMPGR